MFDQALLEKLDCWQFENNKNWCNLWILFQYTLLDVQSHVVKDKESMKPQHLRSVKVYQIENAPKKGIKEAYEVSGISD